MRSGYLMDTRFGCGWRLVVDANLAAPAAVPGLAVVSLADDTGIDSEGVVAAWMQRHSCHVALVRPDHYAYGTATKAGEFDALLAEFSALSSGVPSEARAST
jgi:3-(3-hydroxy-phenyl)propionate hydroxylase